MCQLTNGKKNGEEKVTGDDRATLKARDERELGPVETVVEA